MRLHRPYTPLRVRVQVAESAFRSYFGRDTVINYRDGMSDGDKLKWILKQTFGDQKVELHHRPALCNRQLVRDDKFIYYDPDANDPDYLVYLPADEHDIETRVRGQHGQHSDLALARKRKRKERKAKRPKYKWPKRKFNRRGK